MQENGHFEDQGQASRGVQSKIGLKDFLTVISRRRWVVLGIAIPVIIIALIGTMRTSNVTTASSMVMLEMRRPENPSFGFQSINYDVEISSAAQVAMSIPVSRMAAAALMDSLPSMEDDASPIASVENEDDLMELLQEGIDCSQVGESTILRIAYTHPNPMFALAVVDKLTDAYIDYTITREHNPRAVEYYTDQIDNVQAEIDSLLGLRADILRAAGYAELETDVRSTSNLIWSLEDDYYRARSKRVGLESRYNGLMESIRLDPDFVPSTTTGQYVELGNLKMNLVREKAALAAARLKYTADSVWVQRQSEMLENTRQELHRERQNLISGIKLDLEEARSTELELARVIEQQRGSLDVYPDVERRVTSLQYQINTRTDLIETLHMKRGEVRLKSASDQRISNIIPLNEPSIEAVVGGGKKVIYLTLATILALALGILAALFIDNSDRRIYTKRQAEESLGVNVLGYVSDDGSER